MKIELLGKRPFPTESVKSLDQLKNQTTLEDLFLNKLVSNIYCKRY